ncbi:MAG: hypothetical protein KY476_11985 [Planctomycetes bacterium]|nr:hypothetical protein [Planctomycetota bacterium]
MQEYELELSVGDVLVIGNRTITVVDIDGPEVSFRVDDADGDEFVDAVCESFYPAK